MPRLLVVWVALRGFLLIVMFALLVAATLAGWSRRFEMRPDVAVWRLGEDAEWSARAGLAWAGEGKGWEFRVSDGIPRIVAFLALPETHRSGLLHAAVRMDCEDLEVGAMPWEDGRLFLEWRDPGDGSRLGIDTLGSVRSGMPPVRDESVFRPPVEGAIAVLRVEHLGSRGMMRIGHLELRAVRESAAWRFTPWLLGLGWFGWLAAACRHLASPGLHSWWRAVPAAAAVMVFAHFFILPGPWKAVRPFGIPFHLPVAAGEVPVAGFSGPAARAAEPAPLEGSAPAVGEASSLGKIGVQGGLVLKIKHALQWIRPVLHALLLAAPAWLLACLCGRRAALWVCVMLSLGVESAQMAFGYGFDWVDVFDLFCDAAGIAVGLWIHRNLPRQAGRFLPGWIPAGLRPGRPVGSSPPCDSA